MRFGNVTTIASSDEIDTDAEVNEDNRAIYDAIMSASAVLGKIPDSLDSISKLDTCVTVVDCKAFSGDVATCDSLLERYIDQVREIKD